PPHSRKVSTESSRNVSSVNLAEEGEEKKEENGAKPSGIRPALRQIQSSASLRSRNLSGVDDYSPGTPSLYSSSSTTNLRLGKAFPLQVSTGTPTSSSHPPLPSSSCGMNLFDSKLPSPTTARTATH